MATHGKGTSFHFALSSQAGAPWPTPAGTTLTLGRKNGGQWFTHHPVVILRMSYALGRHLAGCMLADRTDMVFPVLEVAAQGWRQMINR